MKSLTTKALVILLMSIPNCFASNLTLTTRGEVAIDFLVINEKFNPVLIINTPEKHVQQKEISSNFRNDCIPVLQHESSTEIRIPLNYRHQGCRYYLNTKTEDDRPTIYNPDDTFSFALCLATGTNSCDVESSILNTLINPNISPLYSNEASLKDRIFKLEWNDPVKTQQNDSIVVAIVRMDLDSDSDGLWDDWELFGIDANGDGEIDLTLKDADPERKDIYVEIDAMGCPASVPNTLDCHRPKDEALKAVITAFENAPVLDANGKIAGINLHLDVDEIIPHKSETTWDQALGKEDREIDCNDSKNDNNFACEKKKWFGTKSQRENPTQLKAKALAYHYSLWAHSYSNSGGSSGISETSGNDLLVTLGNQKYALNENKNHHVGDLKEQAGTFMHELGHNLGLLHGGGDDINYKPNYLSIMNYRWQHTWIQNTKVGPRLDYSRQTLKTLDERSLIEIDGVLGSSQSSLVPAVEGDQLIWCPLPNSAGIPYARQQADINGKRATCNELESENSHWINWNFSYVSNDGELTGTVDCEPISVNLNGGNDPNTWGACTASTQRGTEILEGWNDWQTLFFQFQSSSEFND